MFSATYTLVTHVVIDTNITMTQMVSDTGTLVTQVVTGTKFQ